MNKKLIKPAQIVFTKSFQLKNSLVCDYVYVSDDKFNDTDVQNKYHYLRIQNIEIEFLLAKLPYMSENDFKNKTKFICQKNYCDVSYVKMMDCCLFSFDHMYMYAKVLSTNIWNLKKCYDELNTFIIKYYSKIQDYKPNTENNSDDYYDYIFFKNTESPFRFTQNVLNINNIPYYLSVKYDIPCIGAIAFDTKYFTDYNINDKFSDDDISDLQINDLENILDKSDISPRFNNFITKNIAEFKDIKNFVKDFSITGINENNLLSNIRVMSYDIETYNPVVKLDPTDKLQPIIAIGFGVFKINDGKPIRRFCITSKDLNDIPSDLKFSVKNLNKNIKLYKIQDTGDDETYYIVVNNEKEILNYFIKYIQLIRPYIITGFNNWSFDDKWIQKKCEMYKLDRKFIKSLNYYVEPIGKFVQVNPKLDNEKMKKTDYYTWRQNFTTFHDCMIAAKKEDPKRFSERSRSNLDTMLATYKIKSPYGEDIEKDGHISKTGLKIHVMFDYWKTNQHIYDIVKYCCQDAWITGTFAIKRNMLGDLIEMSSITYTNFDDSLHKAVGIRVSNTISWYAYHENFALFDTPNQESRTYQLKSPTGNKFYDRRTLIGGAVKNKRNGREFFIQALDFSSMYPSQKEGSNVDTSSRVDSEIILNYEKFGLTLKNKYFLEDMYCDRWFYEFETKNKNLFCVEQLFSEYKLDQKRIKEIKEKFNKFNQLNEFKKSSVYESIKKALLKTLKQLIHPFETYKTNTDGSLIILSENEKNNYLLELMTNDIKFPQTVMIPIFFCQSPKDSITDLPLIHYSLKEKMLSDFRAKRSAVKKQMSITKSQTEKIQLSAKEKAIKVVMNSEYGQTGSDLFAHFDSDIGAAVTFASRHCIGELTSCLYSNHFYVDESYLTDKNLLKLIEYKIATIEKIKYIPTFELTKEGSQRTDKTWKRIYDLCFKDDKFIKDCLEYHEIDWILPPRRITVKNVYDKLKEEYLKHIEQQTNEIDKSDFKKSYSVEVYRITLPKSELVYQDTDSNYYTNETIIKMWNKINPETINEIMNVLYIHNKLLSRLIPDIIHRRPIGVGWEGAFIVARYLNKKKKYYGKKWQENGMSSKIQMWRSSDYKLNDYESKHIIKEDIEKDNKRFLIEYDWKNLPNDYEDYLNSFVNGHYNTYNSTIPYKNGDYFKASNIGNSIDHLDFVNNNGIKCTGVDLARREQYKFINYNNLLIYQNDLRYLPLSDESFGKILDFKNFNPEINLEIENFIGKTKQPLKDVVAKLLKDFYIQVQNMKSDNFISCYPLEFFVKQKAYKEDKATEMRDVVRKMNEDLLDENLEYMKDKLKSVIPKHGERHGYVCIDEFNDLNIVVPSSAIKDMAYSIDHMRLKFCKGLDFIDDVKKRMELDEPIFRNLNYHYYFEQLATVLCNYIVIEERPSIVQYIDGTYEEKYPETTDKEIKDLMDKEIEHVKKSLAKKFIDMYFPKRHKNKVKLVDNFEFVDIQEILDLEDKLTDIIKLNYKHSSKDQISKWIYNQPRSWIKIFNECDLLTRKKLEQIEQTKDNEHYNNLLRLNSLYHNFVIEISRKHQISEEKFIINFTKKDTNSKGTLINVKFINAKIKQANRQIKLKPFLTIIVTKNLFDSVQTLTHFIENYFKIVPNSNGFRINESQIDQMKKFLEEILI